MEVCGCMCDRVTQKDDMYCRVCPPLLRSDLWFTAVSCFQSESLTLPSTFYSFNIPKFTSHFRTGALWSYHVTCSGHILSRVPGRDRSTSLAFVDLNLAATINAVKRIEL